MTLPTDQIVDSHLLTADGIIYLYELWPLVGGTVYLKADNNVTWQGNTYQGTAVQIDQRERNADGQLSRPKLTIANPLGVYSALVSAGVLENATIYEKKILYNDLINNNNIFDQRTWKIRRVLQLNRMVITMELRDTLDGQAFLLPARLYMPPDFPSVSL